MTIEKQIKKENTKRLNEGGYTKIKLSQSFKRPEDFIKIDWSRKYTPKWALDIPAKVIEERPNVINQQ